MFVVVAVKGQIVYRFVLQDGNAELSYCLLRLIQFRPNIGQIDGSALGGATGDIAVQTCNLKMEAVKNFLSCQVHRYRTLPF